jgi:tetratricopeptide (TPR) repeat protein
MSLPGKGLGPSREDQEKHLQALLVQAVHHHQRGQLEEAISLYQQVLQARPAHPEALHLLGVCRQQQGVLEEAIALMQQALAQQPWFPDAHYNLAIALKQVGYLEEAKAHLQQAVGAGGARSRGPVPARPGATAAGGVGGGAGAAAAGSGVAAGLYDAAHILAILLRDCGQEEEAAKLFYQLWQADPADLAAALGWCVSQLPLLYDAPEQIASARQRYRQALEEVKARWEQLPRDPETLEQAAAGSALSSLSSCPTRARTTASCSNCTDLWWGRSWRLATPSLPFLGSDVLGGCGWALSLACSGITRFGRS